MQRNQDFLKKVVMSSLFLAAAVVLNLLSSFYIPLFGANSVKISFSGVLTFFPAMLFGPVYGAAVSGLSDLIGYILKPAGPYIPLITLTAAAGGAINGLLWRAIRKRKEKPIRITALSIFAALGLLGIIMHISLVSDGVMNGIYAFAKDMPSKETALDLMNSGKLSFPSRIVFMFSQFAKTEEFMSEIAMFSNMMTIGFEVISLSGIVALSVDLLIKKRSKKEVPRTEVLRFIAVMLVSGLIITTLNTGVLMIYYEALANRAFMLLWIPRVIKEIFTVIIQAYLASALYNVYVRSVGVGFLGDNHERI